ncbi:S4 domain-containing protein YaaA [Culicoidibacter larvae]|uniref:S4 domain-containing protein YaaA n=1 Tax=Culicoidibacter larvae TaxID=2579976 RepID=A0A5R8QGQ8_9FIRM|nr:S4 domain-containing protein YaaA [Culicoidibacter larvae]TLG77178.1 S4 domain-containing protein YaaA [Culicoidibacter larvae]
MQKVQIETEFITLGQFLKVTGIIGTGGAAKFFLEEYPVYVNNELENRRGRKLYVSDQLKVDDQEFIIVKG